MVEGGKGVTSEHAHLGSEVTHVVCHPEAAASWLAMGEPLLHFVPFRFCV